MLAYLSIRDLLIVERLDWEPGSGMTALSGETGAGKSILVDALGLALGMRASADLVRPGSERVEVSAGFDLDAQTQAGDWLAENGLDAGDQCVLRRSVGADGRSRAFINDRPVTVQALRALGARLVLIHGQHAHQSLLERDTQRQLLDDYGGYGALLSAVAAASEALREVQSGMRDIGYSAEERAARQELLRYQVEEIERAAPADGEFEALESEYRSLEQAEDLLRACAAALQRVDDDEDTDAAHGLGDALRLLGAFEGTDRRVGEAQRLLEEALIRVREAASSLRDFGEGFEADPERLRTVAARLDTLHELARKHHVRPAELPALALRLRAELAGLEDAAERLAELEREAEALNERYRRAAKDLHAKRTAAAKRLGTAVSEGLRSVGMSGAHLEVAVLHQPGAPVRHGNDLVEFRVSTNAGLAPQSLARVASGGELSRLSLVLETTTRAGTGIPTLVFDEVDTGIGGRVAEIVGRQMSALARRCQVLCVTHLPQVAAQADHHVQIIKEEGAGTTRTALRPLDAAGRVEELARMLGGVRVTERTRAHAREMLEQALGPA